MPEEYDFTTNKWIPKTTFDFNADIASPETQFAMNQIGSQNKGFIDNFNQINKTDITNNPFSIGSKENTVGTQDIFGGEDSMMGMPAGKFALGAGQLVLGIADFFGTQKYNDAAIDTMKANTALTQEQYQDFKNFKADTKQAWA